MKSFRTGFNSVVNLEIVRKWIRPDEFWCMTAGVKEITAADVIEYTKFNGNYEKQIGWFTRYLEESNA